MSPGMATRGRGGGHGDDVLLYCVRAMRFLVAGRMPAASSAAAQRSYPPGGERQTLQEWTDIETAKIATKQIVLMAAAVAGLR